MAGTCEVRFQWGLTVAYGFDTPWQVKGTNDTFQQLIIDLIPNKTYHFRAQARNNAGVSNGADRTLTTLEESSVLNPDPPSVMTLPATSISESSAQANGMVIYDAGSPGDVSFEWGASIAYGMETPWVSGFAAGATFSALLSPLVPGIAYHYRARFRNRYGVFYGADASFSTLSAEGISVLIDDGALLRLLEVV